MLDSVAVATRPVRLGSQTGHFLTDPIPLETRSYEELFDCPVEAAHCVRFVTPTSVRDGNISSPFLEPSRLAKSAVKRWNKLVDNPTLLLDHRHAAGTWVSDLDGRNGIVTRHRITISGFVGRMRFVCPTKDSARLFSTVWAFAEHAGIGSYTTSGLGRILREPTWQPTNATTPPRSTEPAPVR
jgi:CRISPR/Cas system endoribonuclease Cas6 (RAMP superfamily)